MKFKCTKIVGTLIAAAFVLSGCGKNESLYGRYSVVHYLKI